MNAPTIAGPMTDAAILAELTANDGAILWFQATNEDAFRDAQARGVIGFDSDADCFTHPNALRIGGNVEGDAIFFRMNGAA